MRIIIGVLVSAFIFIANVYADPEMQVTIDSSVAFSDEPVVAQTEDFINQESMDSITEILQANVPKSFEGVQASLPQEQLPVATENKTDIKSDSSGILVVDEVMIKDLAGRVAALEIQNTVLQNQVALLTEKLVSGTSIAGAETLTVFSKKVREHIDGVKNQMGPTLFMGVVIGIIAVLLFLLVYILIPRRKNYSQVSYPQDDLPNDEKDFNFMEGNEGIAAKLNLARAYIEMGHETKAQSMLYEVLSYGNDMEQEEAKGLLDKIKQHNL